MQNIDLNDFIMDILQDIIEVQSVMEVLKDSAHNENNGIIMTDVGNTLEILIAKMSNTKHSLNKYIEIVSR
jgi:hypothetical protein